MTTALRRGARTGMRSQSAFTLIEIAIVVFILSLVALLTFPRLHHWTGGDARSAARELAGLVDALVQESVASHTMFRLHYDLGAHTFWVTSLTQTGGVLEEGAPRGAVRRLPADVRFRDVATPHQGLMTEGDAFTQFFPSGRVTRTTIHLTEGDHVSTLIINPISGRVSVRDGDLEDRRS